MVNDVVRVKEHPTNLPATDWQRLYGYLKIDENMDSVETVQPKLSDVFTEEEPETDRSPSVLSKKIY